MDPHAGSEEKPDLGSREQEIMNGPWGGQDQGMSPVINCNKLNHPEQAAGKPAQEKRGIFHNNNFFKTGNGPRGPRRHPEDNLSKECLAYDFNFDDICPNPVKAMIDA